MQSLPCIFIEIGLNMDHIIATGFDQPSVGVGPHYITLYPISITIFFQCKLHLEDLTRRNFTIRNFIRPEA